MITLQARDLAVENASPRWNLTLVPGQRLSILGGEGCGKSRLMRVFAGLVPPAHGELLLAGRPMPTWGEQERVRNLGVLFQNPDQQILATTVEEELMLGLVGVVEEEGKAVLEEVGLSAGHWGREMLSLSPSRRDRVALAALLLRRTRLLLLDEPASRQSEAGEEAWASVLSHRAATIGLATITFTSRATRAARFGQQVIAWPGDSFNF